MDARRATARAGAAAAARAGAAAAARAAAAAAARAAAAAAARAAAAAGTAAAARAAAAAGAAAAARAAGALVDAEPGRGVTLFAESNWRRHLVEITDEGRRAFENAEKGIESVEDEVLSLLSAAERVELQALLAKALD